MLMMILKWHSYWRWPYVVETPRTWRSTNHVVNKTKLVLFCGVNTFSDLWTCSLPYRIFLTLQLGSCTTSQKVAGSIPNGDFEILHLLNPSDSTTALGSTDPLTDMSTRDLPPSPPGGCKDGRCVRLTTLPPSCTDCLEILKASDSWVYKGLSRPLPFTA